MVRFLHAADIHLDSPLLGLERYEGAPIDELRSATRRAFDNLVQRAIEQRVDFLVIAGDLYDGDWRDHNTGLYFVKQLSRLQEAGIPVYLIAGNHDAVNRMTRSLRLPLNPAGDAPLLGHEAPETRVLTDLGVAIHGRSFANAAETENLARHYPAAVPGMFNLGLLHTSLEGDALHDPYAPCTRDDLCIKDYQYWALGHIHKRGVRHETPTIAYCGNLQGRHIRETGAKGCLLVSVDARHNVQLEFEPLDVLRWEVCQVDCTGASDGAEALARFRGQLEQLVHQPDQRTLAVRVELVGACEAHRSLTSRIEDWTAELRAAAIDVGRGGVWIEKVKFATRPPRRGGIVPVSAGPIEEMMGLLRELHADDDSLHLLRRECDVLRGKLPPEVLGGLEGWNLEDPSGLRDILRDVEPLLLERLTAPEGR